MAQDTCHHRLVQGSTDHDAGSARPHGQHRTDPAAGMVHDMSGAWGIMPVPHCSRVLRVRPAAERQQRGVAHLDGRTIVSGAQSDAERLIGSGAASPSFNSDTSSRTSATPKVVFRLNGTAARTAAPSSAAVISNPFARKTSAFSLHSHQNSLLCSSSWSNPQKHAISVMCIKGRRCY